MIRIHQEFYSNRDNNKVCFCENFQSGRGRINRDKNAGCLLPLIQDGYIQIIHELNPLIVRERVLSSVSGRLVVLCTKCQSAGAYVSPLNTIEGGVYPTCRGRYVGCSDLHIRLHSQLFMNLRALIRSERPFKNQYIGIKPVSFYSSPLKIPH